MPSSTSDSFIILYTRSSSSESAVIAVVHRRLPPHVVADRVRLNLRQGKSSFAHGGETQESAVKRRKPPEPSPSPPPLFGQIHTFSASGSLRGSGDAQEQQGRYPSRNSYDNYMQIYANNNGNIGNHNLKDQFPSSIPYHPHQQGFRSSPTTLPKVHVNEAPYIQGGDRSNGALVEINGNSHGTAGQST